MHSPEQQAKKPKFSAMSRKKPDPAAAEDSIRKRMFRLKFSTTESVPVNLREYGLMQTSRQTDTPYPRNEQPVDPSLLKARLVESKQSPAGKGLKAVASNQSTGSGDPDGQHLSQTTSVEAAPGPIRDSASLLLGTPHPRKGQALDPKTLIRQLSVAKIKRLSLGAPRSSYGHLPAWRSSLDRARAPDVGHQAHLSTTSPPVKGALTIGTPHPRKGYALNARDLAKQLEVAESTEAVPAKSAAQKSPRKEKSPGKQVAISLKFGNTADIRSASILSVGSGRHTACSFTSDTSVLTMASSHESGMVKMSFEERRRLFYQAEFTIAKNGRKMSDIIMAVPQKPVEYTDKREWQGHDQAANTELEEFIRSQGLIKTQRDQLTITRMPPAVPSRRQSETDSLRSYRSRSSRRNSMYQHMKRHRTRRNIKFSASEKEKRTYSE
ncbi:uncharacterized protein LOC117896359 [Drosophila subobscura]|uniref:uncharacterized protein LOC117896359 n=1 Tax=Drosophila subobscura TaxID=7241 RepID=UPI00155AEC8D|nr:uncharacterized protein LOC117896359 [Drosophila subobscura]